MDKILLFFKNFLWSCVDWCITTILLTIKKYPCSVNKIKCLFFRDIIIDQLSIERNYLLVRTYVLGGHSERNLPSRTLSTASSNLVNHGERLLPRSRDSNVYIWPLFSSFPMPREYTPTVQPQSSVKKGEFEGIQHFLYQWPVLQILMNFWGFCLWESH